MTGLLNSWIRFFLRKKSMKWVLSIFKGGGKPAGRKASSGTVRKKEPKASIKSWFKKSDDDSSSQSSFWSDSGVSSPFMYSVLSDISHPERLINSSSPETERSGTRIGPSTNGEPGMPMRAPFTPPHQIIDMDEYLNRPPRQSPKRRYSGSGWPTALPAALFRTERFLCVQMDIGSSGMRSVPVRQGRIEFNTLNLSEATIKETSGKDGLISFNKPESGVGPAVDAEPETDIVPQTDELSGIDPENLGEKYGEDLLDTGQSTEYRLLGCQERQETREGDSLNPGELRSPNPLHRETMLFLRPLEPPGRSSAASHK
ncbi:hypothetical protein CISG_09997 [Coccidioides immitis RMSCC 3703]|uniref:Uncharacterized protein n=1 Tax=Coccidioides immitis RMSCC 3703 TaxID=454286 RepID=A0A0J8QLK2_COCIT|nr:hypothetical protein CISG_09997 [Coccidioides immitis RMSCC 3703]